MTDSLPTTSTTNTGINAPEIRYYLLVDQSVQWFTKLARLEVQITWEREKKGGSVRKETIAKVEMLDVPNRVRDSAFCVNIYGREQVPSMTLEGMSWGGWTVSDREAARIKRMVELTKSVEEFEKLSAYT